MGLKHEMGRCFFYRETKGSRGREGANERKTHHALGGEEVGGTPLPPSLDRPSCIARIGVYKSREATGRHS